MREFKSIPNVQLKADDASRTITGVFSVFGNVDDWGDRIHPGAFAKTFSEGRSRARHLWNHSFSQPPIASIKELKEIGRDDLPEDILKFAPEATGGALVTRAYYVKNELAEWVWQAIKNGDVTEMSFGYDVMRWETTKDDEKNRYIREIHELKLYDTSDVLWGMNDATVAKKMGLQPEISLPEMAWSLKQLVEEVKAGRRNKQTDQEMLDQIHALAVDLGCTKCLGIKEDENDDDNENSKNRNAESADTSGNSPFGSDWLKVKELEILSI